MGDPRREGEGGRGARTTGVDEQRSGESGSGGEDGRTAGTNRDFDESGESKNQGHGHPREERGASGG